VAGGQATREASTRRLQVRVSPKWLQSHIVESPSELDPCSPAAWDALAGRGASTPPFAQTWQTGGGGGLGVGRVDLTTKGLTCRCGCLMPTALAGVAPKCSWDGAEHNEVPPLAIPRRVPCFYGGVPPPRPVKTSRD